MVDMNNPGNWILGAPEDPVRNAGLGVLVEYANQHRNPQWIAPKSLAYDLTLFGNPAASPAAQNPAVQNLDMIFEKIPGGAGKFNTFLVNGKPYPHADEFVLHQGQRYRLTMRNRTDDAHPMHLHRHRWEIVDLNGKPTSGVIKDTVIVPFYGRATVEFTADQPGLSLFHCHIQSHMDFGFKALFRYA
jgi:FtsP/CotA-like multicopper oxidase with cupredoxin domain